MIDESGVRYALAHTWLVLAALVAAASSLPGPASFLLLTLVALAAGQGLAIGWRVGIALAAWAIWTGFFENTLGLLTFSLTDVLRLAVLTALAAGVAVRDTRRWDTLAR
jgi:hypothetical protein